MLQGSNDHKMTINTVHYIYIWYTANCTCRGNFNLLVILGYKFNILLNKTVYKNGGVSLQDTETFTLVRIHSFVNASRILMKIIVQKFPLKERPACRIEECLYLLSLYA